jgi:RnfABCDGE-type electron transport complex G subunit
VRASILRKLSPIMFITLVVLISVILLTITESFTSAQLHRQVAKKIEAMFPEMTNYDFENDLYILYADGDKIGYAFLAAGAGYGGEISILVGLEDAETVKGLIIVSHQESPGIGSRITESDFTDQFVGLNINDVALKQDGGQIDGLTGATISSQAVVDAVRETAMEKVKLIEQGAD